MATIYLRELKNDDLACINVWRNDREVVKLLGANFLYISLVVDEQWLASYLNSRASSVRLAIVTIASDLCIGIVNLTNMQIVNRSAEFSIMLGDKEYWSKGIGYEAASQMINHGFYDLNLHRIYLTVLTENVRAQQLYRRLRFKEEGVQREAVYKEGKYHDLVTMALLKSEIDEKK